MIATASIISSGF